MKIKTFKNYRLSKRSEKLFLALILMGYEHYEGSASLTKNSYKYYILRPHKNAAYDIFIHKHKAKYHTSTLPQGGRIKVTKITCYSFPALVAL